MQSKNNIHLACAGAGKTYNIAKDILSLHSHKKILVVTYTNRGIESLINEIENQNLGVIPSYVEIKSWYSFLLSEILKPFQYFQFNKINFIRSLDFNHMYGPDYTKLSNQFYYITPNRDIKARYIAKLTRNMLKDYPEIMNRIENFCSHIYFDEIQDFAGEDIDLIEEFFMSNISVYCVGDNKQATFSTHSSNSKKKKGKEIFKYFYKNKDKFSLNIDTSNISRRMIPELAFFANLVYPNNPIIGIQKGTVENMGVYLILKKDVKIYVNYFKPTILRFNKTIDTLDFQAINFGESKGMTFNRTMIFPNKTFINSLNKLKQKPLKAPEKYFIAVTRAKYSEAIVVDKLLENSIFSKVELIIGNTIINASKYLVT